MTNLKINHAHNKHYNKYLCMCLVKHLKSLNVFPKNRDR